MWKHQIFTQLVKQKVAKVAYTTSQLTKWESTQGLPQLWLESLMFRGSPTALLWNFKQQYASKFGKGPFLFQHNNPVHGTYTAVEVRQLILHGWGCGRIMVMTEKLLFYDWRMVNVQYVSSVVMTRTPFQLYETTFYEIHNFQYFPGKWWASLRVK